MNKLNKTSKQKRHVMVDFPEYSFLVNLKNKNKV